MACFFLGLFHWDTWHSTGYYRTLVIWMDHIDDKTFLNHSRPPIDPSESDLERGLLRLSPAAWTWRLDGCHGCHRQRDYLLRWPLRPWLRRDVNRSCFGMLWWDGSEVLQAAKSKSQRLDSRMLMAELIMSIPCSWSWVSSTWSFPNYIPNYKIQHLNPAKNSNHTWQHPTIPSKSSNFQPHFFFTINPTINP